MKLSNNLKALAIASAVAVPAFSATTAHAELGYNASVASMYLWRGTDASNGPTVSGGIDYAHDTGLYASTWVSSGVAASAPGEAGGYEFDVWAGYAGEAGGFSYDISYWFIEYPQENPSFDAINEVALGLGYDMFSLGVVSGDDGYLYTTLGLEFGDFGFTYGLSTADDDGDATNGDEEYSHFDISYAATDELSFAVSFPMDDEGADKQDVATESLFMMSYSLPIGK